MFRLNIPRKPKGTNFTSLRKKKRKKAQTTLQNYVFAFWMN